MKKVITYGTFDLFHQGHYNILKRAKEYGDYLIVGVTGDTYDNERGKLSVQDSLVTRIKNVMATGFVDEVIVEEYLGQKTGDIIKYGIDVFVIGSDWYGKFDHLKEYCEVVYLERTRNISSTMLRNKEGSVFMVGIATDSHDEGGIVEETKYVSGLHIESIFNEDESISKSLADEFEIDSSFDDYSDFCNGVNLVCIKMATEKRYKYIKTALEQGKNVLSDYPFSLNRDEDEELRALAQEKGVLLAESIVMMHLRAFTQILWMAQDGAIGKILNVNASISSGKNSSSFKFSDAVTVAVVALVKILGCDVQDARVLRREGADGIESSTIIAEYKNTVAHIIIGNNLAFGNKLEIIGEKGTITVKDEWWNTGYFRVDLKSSESPNRYSFNFEGNGYRFVLQEALILMREKRAQGGRITQKESNAMIDFFKLVQGDQKVDF